MPPSTRHNESVVMIQASWPEVFADLADRMGGSILGLKRYLSGNVTVRTPPTSKRWETCAVQQILEIENFVMGFETRPIDNRTQIRVFIDYQLPHHLPGRWLGRLFALLYVRRCVRRMVKDAATHFRSDLGPWVAA